MSYANSAPVANRPERRRGLAGLTPPRDIEHVDLPRGLDPNGILARHWFGVRPAISEEPRRAAHRHAWALDPEIFVDRAPDSPRLLASGRALP